MKNRHWLITIAVAIAIGLIATPSMAKEYKGVNFPDKIRIDNSELILNGLGLRQATSLKIKVYIAGLYLSKISGDPQAILESSTPKRLILHFLRNLSQKDLTKAWDEGFANNAADQIPVLKDRIEKIKSFTKDMKSGQELVFTHKPGIGIEVSIDGAAMGIVEGDDFSRAFFSIWLGSNPPDQNLKNGILGRATP
ncbi:MAG TPA: chalcone isomerase family protein [Candidatus Omnitrophota bacterium]|nr:chalcone isomerase family protein [Candidatus Omnitrophota bacterium]